MFYVALHKGFLCETEDGRLFTTVDIRYAKSWPTFEEADKAAMNATLVLRKYLGGVMYYAILAPAAHAFKEVKNGS